MTNLEAVVLGFLLPMAMFLAPLMVLGILRVVKAVREE